MATETDKTERERFEAWWTDPGPYDAALKGAAWQAWQARAALDTGAVPPGWMLVPVEPTYELLLPLTRAWGLSVDEAAESYDEFIEAVAVQLPASADARQAAEDDNDWRDDPAADERWNAGCDFAMMQLCSVLGVAPQSIRWDAATETLDGDVCSEIGNIIEQALGENWQDRSLPLPGDKAEG